jgi:hypothetical protein
VSGRIFGFLFRLNEKRDESLHPFPHKTKLIFYEKKLTSKSQLFDSKLRRIKVNAYEATLKNLNSTILMIHVVTPNHHVNKNKAQKKRMAPTILFYLTKPISMKKT